MTIISVTDTFIDRAYAAWKAAGNTGTEADYLASLNTSGGGSGGVTLDQVTAAIAAALADLPDDDLTLEQINVIVSAAIAAIPPGSGGSGVSLAQVNAAIAAAIAGLPEDEDLTLEQVNTVIAAAIAAIPTGGSTTALATALAVLTTRVDNLAAPSISATPDGYVNVKSFGTGGSVSDAAVRAAVAACKATIISDGTHRSKKLWFPPGVNYGLSAPLDLYGIQHVLAEGTIFCNFVPIVGAPCIVMGYPDAKVVGAHYEFSGVYINSAGQTYASMLAPLIEFRGIYDAFVRIGECNGWANFVVSVGANVKSAYNEIHLGKTWRLEIHGDSGPGDVTSRGWFNSNQFYGGAPKQFRIGGPWVPVTVAGNVATTVGGVLHHYINGDVIELYNGNEASFRYGQVTVTGATTFTMPMPALSGTGWRAMGPSAYPHNDNLFHGLALEGNPIIYHNQGQFNHCLNSRLEAPGATAGVAIFGTRSAGGNTLEASNYDHGTLPAPGAFDIAKFDPSGKNYAGWKRVPKDWGA